MKLRIYFDIWILIFKLQMPKSKQSDLIVSKYSDDGVSNNILSKEIYEKYSPCKSKFIASSHTKKYISGKLDRAIRQIKYDKKEVTDVVDNKMVVDIWNALCPLLDNEIKVPKGLTKDVFELVDFKKSKKGKSSTQYYDSDESEKDSEASSSEEEKPVSKKTKKMKMKSKGKPKSHKETSESEQDSEASSSEDEKPAPKKKSSPKGHKKSKQVSESEASSESESD